jgi:CRP/FNR family cyclic AMP-dependent transcriptional regulator
MTRTPISKQRALAGNSWFRGLPPAVVAQVAALAVKKTFADGARIHGAGDPPDGLYGLLKGRVRISHAAADGRELLLALFEPGAWWGEISMFDGQPRTHDAHAVGECEVLRVPQEKFHALLQAQPQLYPHFVKLLCDKLRLAMHYIEDAMFLPLAARVAKRLLALQDLKLPQDDLARMLGASRQSISKELKALEGRGLIALRYGQVQILDRAGLGKAALSDSQ